MADMALGNASSHFDLVFLFWLEDTILLEGTGDKLWFWRVPLWSNLIQPVVVLVLLLPPTALKIGWTAQLRTRIAFFPLD